MHGIQFKPMPFFNLFFCALALRTIFSHFQKITRKDMYGRVLSVDLMLTTFFSTVSAFAGGALEDMGKTPEDVSLAMAFIGFSIFIAWGYYFIRERDSF